MVIREGEYRAEIVRAAGKAQGYVYRVYRGEGGKKLAEGCEADPSLAAVKANTVIGELLHQDFECEQRLLKQAG